MNRTVLRRLAIVGSLALLLVVAGSLGAAYAQGNPPDVECGEGVLFNKFDFQDSDITIGDEVPLTASNTDPEQIVTLTKVDTLTYEYEVDPESGLEITKIVVKGGSDSNDVTDIDGTIEVPENISHLTFCFAEAEAPDDDVDTPADDDTDTPADDDTDTSTPSDEGPGEVEQDTNVAGTVTKRPKVAGVSIAKTGAAGLAGLAGSGAGLVGMGMGLARIGRRRPDGDEISVESLQALLKIYDSKHLG